MPAMMASTKRRLTWVYYLIPVFYLGVILLFLYLQFSAKQPFQEKVGNLNLSGNFSRGGVIGRSKIGELTVGVNGLKFLFSRRNPLVAVLTPGGERRLSIESYSIFSDGLELLFANNLLLRFNLNGQLGDRIELKPVIPSGFGNLSSLSLPVRTDRGRLKQFSGVPLLRLEDNSASLFLVLPPGSELRPETSRLEITLDPLESAAAMLIERVEDNPEPLFYWFSRDLPPVEQEAYQRQVAAFLDLSYRHWQESSLAAGGGLDPQTGPSVSGGEVVAGQVEELVAAFLSEALFRGEFQDALLKIRRELNWTSQNTADPPFFLTTPYLGGLEPFAEELRRRAPGQIRRITEQIRQADLSVFRTPRLIRFILNHAPFSLVEEVIRLADGVNLEAVEVGVFLGLLESYLEAVFWLKLGESPLTRIEEIITQRLLPVLLRQSGGLFVGSSDVGRVELINSLKAGSLLCRTGSIMDQPGLETVGRHLMLSALKLADGQGYLPEELYLREDGLVTQSRRLPPEAVYALVAGSLVEQARYLPQEYPLYRYLAPGSWIWTASRVEGIAIDPQSYRFSFSFPVGQAHYFTLQGIKPFSGIQLHGIPWNPDSRYSIYSDGWYYEESNQTLFVKLTHQGRVEELLINY